MILTTDCPWKNHSCEFIEAGLIMECNKQVASPGYCKLRGHMKLVMEYSPTKAEVKLSHGQLCQKGSSYANFNWSYTMIKSPRLYISL